MTCVSPRGKALLLLLAALLAVPCSLAATPRRERSPRAPAKEPAPAASLAVRLGSWLKSICGKEGSNIDPDGRAVVPRVLAPTGSNIDPHGLGASGEGANIDPIG